MFRDLITINIKAGKGGNGSANFDVLQRPNGGNGGKGGNVYLQGTSHDYDLSRLKKNKLYSATNGEQGSSNNKTGEDGSDITIDVPLTTVVYSNDGYKVIEISKNGQKYLIAEGGLGGRGNYEFRHGGFETKFKLTEGRDGDYFENLKLELELESDFILIGFPNAGKSSLLKELTNAEAKVAAYAFTTIDPQLGDMNGIRILDLPGLIEGTNEGKGLGTRFVKHTRRSKTVLHCVSLEDKDPIQQYKILRTEIKKIDKDLFNKPEIILLTKSDAMEPSKVKQTSKDFKKEFVDKEVLTVSILDDKSLEGLKKVLVNSNKQEI